MSGKLLSLFDHPEFVRRSHARAERELAASVLPAERISASRVRCRRCAMEYEVIPRLPPADPAADARCPRCEPVRDLDALEAFLARLICED